MNIEQKSRAFVVLVSILFLFIALGIVLKVFNENMMYFYTPSEIVKKGVISSKQKMRVGGFVEVGSVHKELGKITFIVTDSKSSLKVEYEGIVPALFRENQGTIAIGHLSKNGVFIAEQILAKHDENYIPKEVVEALKKQGYWKAEGGENQVYPNNG